MKNRSTLFVQAGEFHLNPDHIIAFRQSYRYGKPEVRVWTTDTGGDDPDGAFTINGTVEEFRDLLFKAGCDVYFTTGSEVTR